MVTCTNPSCGKAFDKPLKTINLQEDSAEPYSACTYCLMKIFEPEPIPEKMSERKEKPEAESSIKEKTSKNKEKPSGCNYHLGYLSEREQKGQIPDECIVCKNIVDCMLKKVLS